MGQAGAATPVVIEEPTSSSETLSPIPRCPNCSSSIVADYCAECGERQPSRHDFSTRALVRDALHEITSIDGRLVRSVVALITRPGLLTREWFEGRRGRYVKPFSLFLLLNVAFFVIQPHTQLLSYKLGQYMYGDTPSARHRRALVETKRARMSVSTAEFETRFNDALQNQKKTLLAFCIPVLALGLAVLYIGRGKYLAEHLVFSVHAYAFLLVFLGVAVPVLFRLVLLPIAHMGVSSPMLQRLEGDTGISILLAVVMGTYLYRALRRVYGDRPLPALLRAAMLFYLVGALTNVYHDVLFYTTLYSL